MDALNLELEEKLFEDLMNRVVEVHGEILSEINSRLQTDPSAAVPEDVHTRCLALINSYFSD